MNSKAHKNSSSNYSFKTALVFAAIVLVFSVAAVAQTAQLVVESGHSEQVESVAISPDGRVLVTGSRDHTLKLWDIETGRELITFGSADLAYFFFSSDGHTFVYEDDRRRNRLWDLTSWRETGTILNGILSPDLRYRIVRSGGQIADFGTNLGGTKYTTITVLNSKDGSAVKTFTGSFYSNVEFSRDGRYLVWADSGKTAEIYDFQTGELKRIVSGIDSPTVVRISPDGNTIAISRWANGGLRLFDLNGRETSSIDTGAINYGPIFSNDGNFIAAANKETVTVVDLASGKKSEFSIGPNKNVRSIAFTPDSKNVAIARDWDNEVAFWNVETGKPIETFKGNLNELTIANLDSGSMVGVGSFQRSETAGYDKDGNRLNVWDLLTGNDIGSFTISSSGQEYKGFTNAGQTVLFVTSSKKLAFRDITTGFERETNIPGENFYSLGPNDDTAILLTPGKNDIDQIELWKISAGQRTASFPGHRFSTISIDFSPDGKLMATGGLQDGIVDIWDIQNKIKLATIPGNFPGQFEDFHSRNTMNPAFSPDGKTLAIFGTDDGIVKFWSLQSKRFTKVIRAHAAGINTLDYSPDGKLLATGSNDQTIKVWDAVTGRLVRELRGHTNKVASVSFHPNRKLLISDGLDRKTRVWSLENGAEICSIVPAEDKGWAVVTPEGRFDTNLDLSNIDGLHWVISDDPLKPVPLDIFVRDYYEPKLLPRLIACTEQGNCQQEFRPLPPISELNRIQPTAKILNVSMPDEHRKVKVTVETAGGSLSSRNCKMKRCETGAFDLRLFRDGRLVGSYPNNSQSGLDGSFSSKSIDDKEIWRNTSRIPLSRTSACTNGVKECAIAEFDVQLPFGKNAADVEFSAYVFNEDRVKGKTAIWNGNNWGEQSRARLPKAEVVRPRAYIISVGVNATNTGDWNLELAVSDAEQTQRVLKKSLEGNFEVVPVKLVSEFDQPDHPGSRKATKAIIRTVLDILSGKPVNEEQKKSVPNWQELKKAAPDDVVFISFSSHGYLDRRGMFYLLPADTVRAPGDQKLPDTASMISSDELADWLKSIDAGDMVMIIDTCYAEAVVTGTGFKPAPIGSRGLGQIAYDKQMRILTATRQKDEAIEVRKGINQGLLTAALVQGLDEGLADFKPKPDGKILLGEWLDFATVYVPKLFQQVLKGEKKGFVENKSAGYKKAQGPFLQTPVLFDLRRSKSRDLELAFTAAR